MKPRYDAEPPRPSELAAYVDGELADADRRRVEIWLEEHAEALAEVRSLRRLRKLCQRTAAPKPADAAWAHCLERIAAGVVEQPPVTRRRIGWGWLAAASAAAAVLVALVLQGSRVPEVAAPTPDDAPFAVVSSDDIEITSVDAGDSHALLVGDLPLRADIVLMSAGDVALRSVESDRQWGFPDMHMGTDGNETPMIYAPLVAITDP